MPMRFLFLILLILSLGFSAIAFPRTIHTEPVAIALGENQLLVGRLYVPEEGTAPYPAMLLCHGASSTKDMMEPLAIALAQQGVAALAIDFGGFGESYRRGFSEEENLTNAEAAIAYLRSLPERFDGARLGVGGHSMGAATALALAAQAPDLRVTVDLGMSAPATPTVPPNLFMGIGLYEQFHSPGVMRQMLQEATGQAIAPGEQAGEFSEGTARKLVISPTTDHVGEPFDPVLIREALQWTVQAFQLPRRERSLWSSWLTWARGFSFVSGLVVAGYLAQEISRFTHSRKTRTQSLVETHAKRGSQPKIGSVFLSNGGSLLGRRSLPWLMVGCGFTILILGQHSVIPSPLASSLLVFGMVALPVVNDSGRSPQNFPTVLAMGGLYGGVAIAAYAVVTILGAGWELLTHPVAWLGLPQFLIHLPMGMGYSTFQAVRAVLFPLYTLGLRPGFLVALILPELVLPGITLALIARGGKWLLPWLRQPLKLVPLKPPEPTAPPTHSQTGKQLVLLGGLGIVFLAVVYQRAQAGIVSLETALNAFRVVGQFALFPALLIVLTVRSPWFQQWENRIRQSGNAVKLGSRIN